MLRAGFSRVEIAVSPECNLLGYDFRQTKLAPGNRGTNDPLYIRALVIDAVGVKAALIALDLAIVETPLARKYRALVAQKIECPPEHVILACSHTHSAPFPISDALLEPSLDDQDVRAWQSKLTEADKGFAIVLTRAIDEAVSCAAGKMYPVQLWGREAPLGLGYNRRVQTTQGIEMCWSPQEYPTLNPEMAADPTCTVFAFEQLNGPRRYLLWGHGAHGTTMGKTFNRVSADWPGLACKQIETEIPDASAMFFSGACADVHPWIATQEDPKYLEPVAKAAASFVGLLTHAMYPLMPPAGGSMRICTQTLQFGNHELDVSVWRLGSAWIVALPVELFGSHGIELRHRLKDPVLLATCANGQTGYWPTGKAFAEGGYEIDCARATGRNPGDAEKLIEEVVRIAHTLL